MKATITTFTGRVCGHERLGLPALHGRPARQAPALEEYEAALKHFEAMPAPERQKN